MANDGDGVPPAGSEPDPKPIDGENSFALVPVRTAAKGSPQMMPVRTHLASLDLIGLLKSLQRRWLLALTFGLLFAGSAGVATRYLLPPSKLTARTRMRIPTTQSISKPDSFTGLGDQRTHLAMLKSRLVLKSALDVPKVKALKVVRSKADPIVWLEKELQGDFANAPEVLSIYLSGDSSHEMTTIVNEVREAYCREILDKDRHEGEKRLQFFVGARKEYEERIRAGKEEQRKLWQKAGADSNSRAMAHAFANQEIQSYRNDLLRAQSDLRRTRAELSFHLENEKDATAAPIAPVAIDDLLNKNEDIQQAQAKVRIAQKEIEDFKRVAVRGEQDPAFAPLALKLKSAQSTLTQMKVELTPVFEEAIRKKRSEEKSVSTGLLKARVGVVMEEEKILKAAIEDKTKQIQDMANNVVQLDVLRESMAVPEKMISRLDEDIAKLEFALKLPPSWSVLEEGVFTQVSDRQRLLMAASSAAGGAFLLVCLAIALWEFRLQRVSSADQVVYGLGVKLVGTIPDSAPQYPRRRGSADEEEMQGLFSDAFDATRTMLLRAAKTHTLQAVMISSAESGEGKTTLSVHLAASLAQVGYRTLLIDADLRNPVAHLVFGLNPNPGLCDLLRVQATVEDVLRPTRIDHLTMLTAGLWDSRATRALAQDGTGGLLRELRRQFEFIIIDTSPVLPVVDPLLIGQHVDGAILSVMRGKSCMPNVYAAHQRLSSAGIRILGTVVNGVRSQRCGAAYYPKKSNSAAQQKT